MRALAVELGVGAASLYRYVARKDELIDLMVDAVMGNDLQFEIRGDWREDLRSFAHGLRAMTLRHPWMAVPSAGLRSLGPNTARRYEQVLSAIDGLGLEIDEMLVMVETLDAFVRGRALEELSEQEAVRRSGLDQEQWMQTQTPLHQEPDRERPLPAPHPRRPRRSRSARSRPPQARLRPGARASARWPRHDAPRIAHPRQAARLSLAATITPDQRNPAIRAEAHLPSRSRARVSPRQHSRRHRRSPHDPAATTGPNDAFALRKERCANTAALDPPVANLAPASRDGGSDRRRSLLRARTRQDAGAFEICVLSWKRESHAAKSASGHVGGLLFSWCRSPR